MICNTDLQNDIPFILYFYQNFLIIFLVFVLIQKNLKASSYQYKQNMFLASCRLLNIGKYFFSSPVSHRSVIAHSESKQTCNFQLLQDGRQNSIECVVIVNNKLNLEWLGKALDCCQNIVLADGGANRFYDSPFRECPKVRAIVGDFDSLKPHVRKYYEERHVEFQQVWNQDTNDFEKAVKKAISRGWNKIFCFGAFGGRLDHTLASMHNAQKLSKEHEDLKICLFGQTNLMYFLKKNIRHEIVISSGLQNNFCGLIPFGLTECITTKGFKWNLGPGHIHQSLKWGQFISTSNQVEGDTVQIEASNNLFFVSHFKNSIEC